MLVLILLHHSVVSIDACVVFSAVRLTARTDDCLPTAASNRRTTTVAAAAAAAAAAQLILIPHIE